jgi:hypothetical protein
MKVSQDCFSCLSISFLESTRYSLTRGVPSRRNSKRALLLPKVNNLSRLLISSIAALCILLKSKLISFTVKSTWNGAICSRIINRCFIWKSLPSTSDYKSTFVKTETILSSPFSYFFARYEISGLFHCLDTN